MRAQTTLTFSPLADATDHAFIKVSRVRELNLLMQLPKVVYNSLDRFELTLNVAELNVDRIDDCCSSLLVA